MNIKLKYVPFFCLVDLMFVINTVCYLLMFDINWQVSRLMDLIVNSLYSNKEVFLRELIRYILSPGFILLCFSCN